LCRFAKSIGTTDFGVFGLPEIIHEKFDGTTKMVVKAATK
jgi:hypothetical protein